MLPLRVIPMPGEPPHGVLARLAERHRENNLVRFAATHACPLPEVLQGRCLDRLAGLIGIEPCELQGHAARVDVVSRQVKLAGEALLLNDWSTKWRRWCAACFRDDRQTVRRPGDPQRSGTWHRALWDVRSVTVCPSHHTVVSERCRACGDKQRWRGSALDRCACGADLATPLQDNPTRDGLLSSQYVAGRLGFGAKSALPLVDDLPLKDAIILLERLGECRSLPHGSRKPARRTDLAAVRRDLGAAMAVGWPRCFHQALDAVLARSKDRPGRGKGLIAAYGWIYSQWLSKSLPPSVARTLRDEFAEHARANEVAVRGEPLFGAAGGDTHHLTATSRRLGVSIAALKRQLVRDGGMPPGARRGVATPLAAAHVADLEKRREAELGIAQASASLGIGRSKTRSLMTEGMLPAAGPQRRLSTADVADFAKRLRGDAPITGGAPLRCSSLPVACKSKGVRLETACRAILDGRLRVAAVAESKPGLQALLVVPGDLETLRRVDRGLSVETAARELGIHPDVARWLVIHEMLRRLPGEKGVDRRSVTAFRNSYVTCVSIAREHETSSRKLAEVFARSGLHPAFGPPQCRQIFYERSSLPILADAMR